MIPGSFLLIPKDYARAFCLPVRAHAHALRHCARMDADNPLLIHNIAWVNTRCRNTYPVLRKEISNHSVLFPSCRRAVRLLTTVSDGQQDTVTRAVHCPKYDTSGCYCTSTDVPYPVSLSKSPSRPAPLLLW